MRFDLRTTDVRELSETIFQLNGHASNGIVSICATNDFFN